MTTRLIEPDLTYQKSFVSALIEYHREGLHSDLDATSLAEASAFQQWIDDQRDAGLAGKSSIPRDRVPHRVLWWVDDEHYIGQLRINLVLNEELQAFGGHVGYDVRPSARGQGHASAMLAEALQTAKGYGIKEVLLTCAGDNYASRRVIERNGGRFVDISPADRMRYVCLTG